MGNAAAAAFVAYVLCDLQDSPVDVSNFYASDVGGFGLFTQHGTPKKNYHALRAFQMLCETPRRTAIARGEAGKLLAVGGLSDDAKSATVLLAACQPDG